MKTTYKISEKEIKIAYENPEVLKEMFPKVFEVKIEPGKWYKNTKLNKNIIFIKKINNKTITCFGFDYKGDWMDSEERYNNSILTPANQEEVQTALENEAKKKRVVG